MFSNVNNYEMKMPKMYVELSEEEMEYGGEGLFEKFIDSTIALGGVSSSLGIIAGGCIIAVGTGFTGVGILLGAGIATIGAYGLVESCKALIEIWT
jgi:hypothetical protein